MQKSVLADEFLFGSGCGGNLCQIAQNQGIFRHPLPELLDVPLVTEFGFGVFAIVTLNPGLLRPTFAHSHVDHLPEIYFGNLILTLSVNQFQSITVQLFCKNQITA